MSYQSTEAEIGDTAFKQHVKEAADKLLTLINRHVSAQVAIASVKREPQWLPIEGAPKDGTALIVAVIDDGVAFEVDHGHFEIIVEDEDDGPWDIRDGEPWCSYVGRAAGTYFCHWLPGKEWESTWEISNNFPYTHYMLPPVTATTASKEALRQLIESGQEEDGAGLEDGE